MNTDTRTGRRLHLLRPESYHATRHSGECRSGGLRGVPMTVVIGDLFPTVGRVFYAKAPLVQVTCQVRFPPILRIERDLPVEFQEGIRHAFPSFQRLNPLMQAVPPEILQAMGQPNAGGRVFQFVTEDRGYTLELAPQHIALSTGAYTTWEAFSDLLSLGLQRLIEVYKPSSFSRVGLRYQDLIERSRLGLGTAPWSSLLRKEMLGEMAIPAFLENVVSANRALQISLPSGDSIVLRHGLGTAQGRQEVGYVIDLDFSLDQKIEVADVGTVLNRLHGGVGSAFRWCITDELHRAMDPKQLADEGDTPSNKGHAS